MNTTTLLLGLMFSCIGLGYFVYGRRQSNAVIRYSGLALMVYPYFVDGPWWILGIGVGLMLVPRFIDL